MEIPLEHSWKTVLQKELSNDYFVSLTKTLKDEYRSKTIFPPQPLIFNALNLCPFPSVRVVILGQDPYHGANQAHGLSFSVPDGIKIPPSLRNIYKEIQSDLLTPLPTTGNLERWAKQGVLLLNASLTVQEGNAGSHQKLGWEIFTDAIIKTISENKEHVVFLLWGNYARAKKALIDENKHLILEAPHPSPLSAHNGFFGSQHFSQTNQYLITHNLKPISW